MASSVYVSISGPALSFVIYENVKCFSDQRGFLLGDVINHVTQSISDTHIHNEKMETIIRVNSVLPIPKSASFFNGVGKIDKEKIREFLQDVQLQVVGWYSFRRNASIQPTLVNKLLHREMCAALDHISPDHVAMCLLNAGATAVRSTHAFNHKFVRYCNSKFEALPAQVHNLGLTQQTEYRVNVSGSCESASFTKIVNKTLLNMKGHSDVGTASSIHKDLQDHLRNVIDEIALSESQIAELEEEVKSLREHSGPMPNEILLPKLLQEHILMVTPTTSTTNSLSPSAQTSNSTNSPLQSGNVVQNKSIAMTADLPAPALVPSAPLDNNISALQSGRYINPGESDRSPKQENAASPDPFGYVRTEMLEMSLPHSKPRQLHTGDGKRVGGARSAGRGVRRPQLGDNVALVSPPMTRGYAQAVKKPGNSPDTGHQATAVPVTRTKASHTNGSAD